MIARASRDQAIALATGRSAPGDLKQLRPNRLEPRSPRQRNADVPKHPVKTPVVANRIERCVRPDEQRHGRPLVDSPPQPTHRIVRRAHRRIGSCDLPHRHGSAAGSHVTVLPEADGDIEIKRPWDSI
jgi:hypothetical protein